MDKEGTRAIPSVTELQRIQGMGDLAVTLNTLFKDCVKVLETSGSDVISPEAIVLEDAVTTGVTLSGAMTTGISLTGAITTGISFTNAVTNGISFASGFTGVPISITAGTSYAINIAITTAAVGAFTGINTVITGGVAHTGNVAGSRSYVTSDNTGRTYANLFGLVAKATVLHADDQVSGTMTGLLCQIDLGAASNSNTCNAWGLCVNHIETGTRAKIPVAFIRFTDADYAGSAPTNYLFDCGGTGNEFPTGSGKIYYNNTLWCRVNGTDQYLYMSKAEGYLSITDSATTAIAIATGTYTTGLSIAGTVGTGIAISSASLTDGIKISGTTPVDGIEISSACSGSAINLSGASATGLTIARGHTSGAIRVGSWKASQALGNAVVLANTMHDGVDTSQLDIISAFGETVADLTGAYSAKVIRGRHLISAEADTDIAQETYGIVGQLVIKNISFGHYHFGVMGTFETTTLCHVKTNYAAGGICARLGGSGTTVESGGLLAGIASIQHMSAFTATGTLAAFATHKTATGIAWPVGIYMQPSSVNQVFIAGTSADPVVNDTVSCKFLQFYLDCGATSGTSVGLYLREYLTGAGGSNAVARIYSDVSVAASTAQGMQCSLGFGESTSTGSVTGLGVAGRFQIGLANAAYPGTGTLAVVQSEIYSFGADADPAGNNIAMFGVVNDGAADGMADVDDDAVLFHFRGWTVADGNMIAIKAAAAAPNVTHSFRMKLPDGSLVYFYAGPTALTA